LFGLIEENSAGRKQIEIRTGARSILSLTITYGSLVGVGAVIETPCFTKLVKAQF
jgi:hypothetical protein